MAELKQALMLKLHVSLGDCVVADDEFLGKGANARHEVAVLQDPGFNCVAHLLHELEIEGMTGGGIDTEDHGETVPQ